MRIPKPPLLSRLQEGHAVIEASAGTGKTYTLERLVADAVLRGTKLERILVVTFTDKAAQELRTRIRAFLEGLLRGTHPEAPPEAPDASVWILDDDGGGKEGTFASKGSRGHERCAWEDASRPIPGTSRRPPTSRTDARARVSEALRSFDRATLSTIHGFCRTVLQETALEAGSLFSRELVEEKTLFERAFRICLAEHFAVREPERELLRLAQQRLGSMEKLLDLLWSVQADGGRLFPRLEEGRAVRSRWNPAWATQQGEILSHWTALKINGNTRNSAAKQMQALCELMANPLAPKLEVGPEVGFEADLAFALAWKELPGDPRLKSLCSTSEHALEGPALDLISWLREFVGAAPTPEAVFAQAFLPPVQKAMARLCQTEGLFTFSAMIHDVAEALRGPRGEALAERLAARYDLALVDEFQDTDPHQWEIFHRLFRNRGRLLLIGDPKQAIYGFRGGDLPTYRSACADLLEGRSPERLELNFRSTREVLDAVNFLLSPEGPAPTFFSDPGLYPAPVGCGREDLRATVHGAPIVPVDLLQVDTATGGSRLWKQAARALARHLRALKESGIAFGTAEENRILSYGDMQVLVGKRGEGELMARALRAEGIPCAFYKQKALFATREAGEWLDLLRAVARPRDRSRQVRAFLTRFFAFALEDLQGLPEWPEDHPAPALLLEAHALVRQGRLSELPAFLLEATGLCRRLLLAQQGLRALVNLRHLGERLSDQARNQSLDLEDLIRQLERWREGDPSEEGDLQRLEGETEAVQILTLHASKGLEAPIVALFAFGAPARAAFLRYHAEGQRRLHLGEAPAWISKDHPDFVKAIADREEDEEQQRLLYVGLTRAQAKLVLFTFREESAKGGLKRLEGPCEVLNRRLLALDPPPHLFQRFEWPWTRLSKEEDAPPPDLSGLNLPAIPAAPESDYDSLRHAARPFLTTSFTALQRLREGAGDGTDETHASRGDWDHAAPPLGGPLHLDLTREMGSAQRPRGEHEGDAEGAPRPGGPPRLELPRGSHVGQALHELLEWADPELAGSLPWEAWVLLPEVQARLRETLELHGIPVRFLPQTAELVHLGLTTSLAGLPPLCEARHLLRELDFHARFVSPDCDPEAKDLLKGSIDALFETEGRAYILDWKSNHLPDYGPEVLDACVQASYRLQAQIYTQATLAFLEIRDEAAYEARFGGLLYVFLRGLPGAGTWFHRPSWAEVQAWTRELEALHADVVSRRGPEIPRRSKAPEPHRGSKELSRG